jgi:serine protease
VPEGCHVTLRRSIFALTAVCAVCALGGIGRETVKAQANPALPVVTAERALALVHAAERRVRYVPGELIVKFRAGATASQQRAALSVLRGRPSASEIQWIGDAALVHDEAEQDAELAAAILKSQPEVEYAEPNYLRHFEAAPTDPSYSRQWNFTALDLPRAWDINAGATSSIVVAVVDTGVTTVERSFTASTWNGTQIESISVPFRVNPDFAPSRHTSPRDFATAALGAVAPAVVDLEGHGTHVSSTIGEDTNNTVAEAGIAYQTKLMPVKVCLAYWDIQFAYSAAGNRGFIPPDVGGCPTSAIVQGIRYAADNGANVINLSLGGPSPSTAERDAVAYAVDKGVFVAIAAGNGYEDGNPIEYPASYAASIDGAVAVGAVGRSLKRAFYSNTGSYVELVAPGGDPRDGGPDGMIWQATLLPTDSNPATIIFPRFDRYAEVAYAGTSMAAPHVAGLAALMMSQGVTKPAAIEALMKATALDLGAPGRDNEYGHGLIQPRAALRGTGVK